MWPPRRQCGAWRRGAGALFAWALLTAATGGDAALAEAPWLPELPAHRALTDADREEATRAYERADRAFRRGRLAAAQQHADEAYAALPNASTALVRATILAARRDDEGALRAYLVALDSEPTADELALIEAGVARHGPTLERGVWTIAPEPEAATVTLGPLTWTGRRSVALPVGPALATVAADGCLPEEVRTDVVAGVLHGSAVALLPNIPAAPVAVERPDVVAQPLPTTMPGPGLGPTLTIVGAGAIIAIAAGLGYAAALTADDAAALSRPGADGLDDVERRALYDDARADAEGLEVAAWVVGGLGLAAAAAGVVWLVLDAPRASEAAVITVSPVVDEDAASLRLMGRF